MKPQTLLRALSLCLLVYIQTFLTILFFSFLVLFISGSVDMISTLENFDRLVCKTCLMICNKLGNSVVKLSSYFHNILDIENINKGRMSIFHKILNGYV